MKRICQFNKERDLHAVDPFTSSIDLRQAYVNGSVPADVSAADLSFNDVEDPSGLMTSPSDQFEAMRQADYVKGALKNAAESETNAASSAE